MNLKNAFKSVDYKGLAIRHCEKAVIVGVTALLVMFLTSGLKKALSASDITAEKIDSLAEALNRSVQTSEWSDAVAASEQVKNPDFKTEISKLVTGIDASQFELSQPFFKFVDFGGILRQKPEIKTAYNLLAFADKGAVSMYMTDPKTGEILEEEVTVRVAAQKKKKEEEDGKKKKAVARNTPRGRSGRGMGGDSSGMSEFYGGGGEDMADMMSNMRGMMGGRGGMGMGGMGMGGMGMGGMSDEDDGSSAGMNELGGNLGASQRQRSGGSLRRARSKAEDEDDQFIDQRPQAAAAGQPNPDKTDPKTPVKRKIKKEEVRGLRWAVITALFDHDEQVKEFKKALHTEDDPPDYAAVLVERREVLSDGSFSEWAPIDIKKEASIQRILPERWEPEHPALMTASAVFKGLIMPLPELAAGRWMYFNQKSAVEAAQKAATSPVQMARGGYGGSEDMESAEDPSQEEAMSQLFSGRGGEPSVGSAGGPMGGRGGSSAGMPDQMRNMESMRRGMGQLGGMGGSSADMNMSRGRMAPGGNTQATARAQAKVQRTRAEIVQIRFVDYTVAPEHTYQYRFKVVVKNPNFGHLDVINENLAKDETLTSDQWSDPSLPVFVPGDTEYFVLAKTRDREEAKLQVHKWLANLGDWQYSDFPVKPGDPIGGEVREYPLIDWDDKLRKERMDFGTRDLLLDVSGGNKTFTFLVDGKEFTYNEPLAAEILVVDRLGDLATRNEDFDKNNADRKERESAISQLRKDAKEHTDSSSKKARVETGGREDFDDRVPSRRDP